MALASHRNALMPPGGREAMLRETAGTDAGQQLPGLRAVAAKPDDMTP